MIKFGFVREEKKKEEDLFDFPHLVVWPKPSKLNKVHKFVLKKARELFAFDLRENKLSWYFDPNTDGAFYLINVTKALEEVNPLINVNLSLDFNSKPLYERMEKILDWDSNQPQYFKLERVEDMQGFPTIKLELINEEATESTNVEIVSDIENSALLQNEDDFVIKETIL